MQSEYTCEYCGNVIYCKCGQGYEEHQGIAEDGASPVLGHTFVPNLPCECSQDRVEA